MIREKLEAFLAEIRDIGYHDEADLHLIRHVFILGALATQAEMLHALILDAEHQLSDQPAPHLVQINRELSELSRTASPLLPKWQM